MLEHNRDTNVVIRIVLVIILLYVVVSAVILPTSMYVLRVVGIPPAVWTAISTIIYFALWLALPLATGCAVGGRVESCPVKKAVSAVLIVALIVNGTTAYTMYSVLAASHKTAFQQGLLGQSIIINIVLIAIQVILAGFASWRCSIKTAR